MIKILLLAGSTAALSFGAGFSGAAYYRPATPIPPPAVTPADITALRQQLSIWQSQNIQTMDELARQYSAMNSAAIAIHQDLLRAEAEHATERAQAAAVTQRFHNDFQAFRNAVPK